MKKIAQRMSFECMEATAKATSGVVEKALTSIPSQAYFLADAMIEFERKERETTK